MDHCKPAYPIILWIAIILILCSIQCFLMPVALVEKVADPKKKIPVTTIVYFVIWAVVSLIFLGMSINFARKCPKGSGRTAWIVVLILQLCSCCCSIA